MELQTFITQTISAVIGGVKDAHTFAREHGARVNPSLPGEADNLAKHGFFHIGGGQCAQLIQFDIALTVKEGTETKGGIGVVAGILALGSTGQSQAENSNMSRIKFSVPLVLPHPSNG